MRRSPAGRGAKLANLIGLVVFLSFSVGLVGGYHYLSALPKAPLAVLSSIAMLVGLAYIIAVSPRGIFSFQSVYAIVFTLFHFGLTIVIGYNLPISQDIETYVTYWMYRIPFEQAVVMVTLSLGALAVGVSIAALLPIRRKGQPNLQFNEKFNRTLTVIGSAIAVTSVASWFAAVLYSGGLNVFTGSYMDYLRATSGQFMPYIIYFIGTGLMLLAAATPSRLRRLSFYALAAFAMIGFPLGLRGEVLFPIAAAAAVVGMRRIPITAGKAALIFVALLSLIAGVRQVRQSGLKAVELKSISVIPSDALAEMGSTIRPVAEVISWEQAGQRPLYGQSYWAPIDRALIYVIPGWTRPEAWEDERLLNVAISETGSIGFSVVAEAYRNLGGLGVLIAMALVGCIMGRIDRWPPTQLNQIKAGLIALPLIINVRNAFTAVPFQILVGYLLFVGIRFMARQRRFR